MTTRLSAASKGEIFTTEIQVGAQKLQVALDGSVEPEILDRRDDPAHGVTSSVFSGFDQLQPLMNQVVERTESALLGRGRCNTLVDIGLSEHWVAHREEEDGPVSLFNNCRNQTLVLNGHKVSLITEPETLPVRQTIEGTFEATSEGVQKA